MAMENDRYPRYNQQRQKGVALVVSLILLATITLLSVSAMRNTNLDTKIAVNHQFKEMSFQAAESALAKLTGPDHDAVVPPTVNAPVVTTTDYYTPPIAPSHEVGTSIDLTMDFTEHSPPGKYKFSGFGLNIVTLVYQADATGRVAGSNIESTNRMEVGLVRK
ncbi:MAG: hypothetical protein KZQ88_15280 [Candidatus Thiodiazotropha sp. (ex Dulcina madagascariensis)]|nr:hypothetical protein [Candidatus Thiodiazotropha sp. (ex Dulcina madagascariensis)]MCU7926029.1 hypothetical protein [Candidatus Thiodiazotropha sp. (ex Dulcina madagascariensis)]